MAKKQLSKMTLLPLFLAGITLASAGILTGVNLLTAPFIEKNEINKKYEGYKKILEIDAFDEVKELTLPESLSKEGVLLKQSFIVGAAPVGVVYDANVKGWSNDLIFQVGFKGNVYAGFNLVSSNETPGIGVDYLKLVNDRIKGVTIGDPILVDVGGDYTGVTAPITAGNLRKVLELCGQDFLGGDTGGGEEQGEFAEALGLLEVENIDAVKSLAISQDLTTLGVTAKEEYRYEDRRVGLIYEANITGYHEDLIFKIAYKDNVYAGFKVIEHGETPGLGANYLETVNEQLKGVSVDDPVLVDNGGMTNVTVTRSALKAAIDQITMDYKDSPEIIPFATYHGEYTSPALHPSQEAIKDALKNVKVYYGEETSIPRPGVEDEMTLKVNVYVDKTTNKIITLDAFEGTITPQWKARWEALYPELLELYQGLEVATFLGNGSETEMMSEGYGDFVSGITYSPRRLYLAVKNALEGYGE